MVAQEDQLANNDSAAPPHLRGDPRVRDFGMNAGTIGVIEDHAQLLVCLTADESARLYGAASAARERSLPRARLDPLYRDDLGSCCAYQSGSGCPAPGGI